MIEKKRYTYIDVSNNDTMGSFFCNGVHLSNQKVVELLNENERLKKDIDYWKQVASQYSNELNVFEHCKKYKTECKDIHWSSD